MKESEPQPTQAEMKAQAMEVYNAIREAYERNKKAQIPGAMRITWGSFKDVLTPAEVQAFANSVQKMPARKAKYTPTPQPTLKPTKPTNT